MLTPCPRVYLKLLHRTLYAHRNDPSPITWNNNSTPMHPLEHTLARPPARPHLVPKLASRSCNRHSTPASLFRDPSSTTTSSSESASREVRNTSTRACRASRSLLYTGMTTDT
eukprot:1160529-Pelagomonas_calceolata.AAC.6